MRREKRPVQPSRRMERTFAWKGPEFSTRAESNLYRSWGVDIIGMTNLPEAKLAREAEICYATIAFATDYDCWHQEAGDVSEFGDVSPDLSPEREDGKDHHSQGSNRFRTGGPVSARRRVEHALITDKALIPEKTRKHLEPIIGKYFNPEEVRLKGKEQTPTTDS